jgi:hypothetical protein
MVARVSDTIFDLLLLFFYYGKLKIVWAWSMGQKLNFEAKKIRTNYRLESSLLTVSMYESSVVYGYTGTYHLPPEEEEKKGSSYCNNKYAC